MRIGPLLAVMLFFALVTPQHGASADVTADSTNRRVAGQPLVYGFAGDGGDAGSATLNKPRDSDYGPDGSLYVVDTFNDRIRKITPDGTIRTVAGNGQHGYNGDGIPARRASLSWPHDVFVDRRSNIFIADSNNHRIRKVTPDGMIHTVVGNGRSGSTGDGGPGTRARIKYPKTVFARRASLFWTGFENSVRRLDTRSGTVSTVAGSARPGYLDGPAARARFDKPQRMQVDSAGNIYVADSGNSAVRRIDAVTGRVSTVVGTGAPGNGGTSGAATRFAIDKPRGIALEGDSVLFVADSQNHRVRRVDLTTGRLTTIADGGKGYRGSGRAVGGAMFYQPRGLTVSPEGDLVVADTLNSVIRTIQHTESP